MFMFGSGVFSHANQVLDQMLERVFICVLGQSTYIERWARLLMQSMAPKRAPKIQLKTKVPT